MVVAGLIVALVVLYVSDWAVWRVRVAEGGGMGSYKVSPAETVGANCILTTYYNKPLSAAPPPKKRK